MVCYKKREDRHRSRRDIYILKNGFQTPGHSYLEKWIRNISMIIALIKSVRITNVAAGTFTWLVGKFQGSLPHPYEHLHFQKWILDTFLTNNSFTFLQAIFIREIGWIAIVATETFTICKSWRSFRSHGPTYVSAQSGGSRMGFTKLISQAFLNILAIPYTVLLVLTIPRNNQPEWKLK